MEPNAPARISRAILTAGICIALSSCSFTVNTANDRDDAQRVSLTDRDSASRHLQELFESKGRNGLSELTNHDDPTIAIHAVWEQAKGDPPKTGAFITYFNSKLKVAPPIWWQDQIKGIQIYKDNCHYVPNVYSSTLEKNSRLTHGSYHIVAKPASAGFPYKITVMNKRENTRWTTEVWAAGRTMLGGSGVHQMGMLVADDRLFVFGAESHGMYAEAFQLIDGKSLLRFCTCYWFNFSERWKL